MKAFLAWLCVWCWMFASCANAGSGAAPPDATPLQALEARFHEQLTQALAQQGIALNVLNQERAAIMAIQDPSAALAKAQSFHEHYRPHYLKALVSMKLNESAIRQILTAPTQVPPDIEGYLRIIRSANRCNDEALLQMCDQAYAVRGGCSFESHPLPGGFSIVPAVNASTDRQVIEGRSNGLLRLWANDVDGPTSGAVGASVMVNPNTAYLCVQTEGVLDAFAVSTFLHHYFFTHAYSHAVLAPKIRFSISPDGYPADCRDQAYPFGTYYYAYRQENVAFGFSTALLPLSNARCGYEGAPSALERFNLAPVRFPFAVEDMAVFRAPVRGSLPYAMDVYYQGELRQSYSGASVHGNLNLRLGRIHVLQIPR